MDPMTSSILYRQFSYLSAHLLLVSKIIYKGMHEFEDDARKIVTTFQIALGKNEKVLLLRRYRIDP